MNKTQTEHRLKSKNDNETVLLEIPRSLVSAVISALQTGRNTEMLCGNNEGKEGLEALRKNLLSKVEFFNTYFFSASLWSRFQILVAQGHDYSLKIDHERHDRWRVVLNCQDVQVVTNSGSKDEMTLLANRMHDYLWALAPLKN